MLDNSERVERRGADPMDGPGASRNPVDNGWRIFSAADTSEYLEDESVWEVVDYNRLCELEPALIATSGLPFGSELELRRDARGEIDIIDSTTGHVIPRDIRTQDRVRHRSEYGEADGKINRDLKGSLGVERSRRTLRRQVRAS